MAVPRMGSSTRAAGGGHGLEDMPAQTYRVVDAPLLLQEQLVLTVVVVQALQDGTHNTRLTRVHGRRGEGVRVQREKAHLILEGQELLVVWDLLGERVRGVHLLQKSEAETHT